MALGIALVLLFVTAISFLLYSFFGFIVSIIFPVGVFVLATILISMNKNSKTIKEALGKEDVPQEATPNDILYP